MPLARGPLEPNLRLGKIERNAPTKPICLAQVEGSIRVAIFCQRPPDRDRPASIAFLPSIDSRTNRLRMGGQHGSSANHQAKQQLTHFFDTLRGGCLTLASLAKAEQGRAGINQFL